MNWRKPVIFAALHLTGSKIPEYIKEIKYASSLLPDKVAEYQEEKLERLLLQAYKHVPYYHRILPEAGVVLGDKVHLENFQNIPILTKEIIREEERNLYSDDCAQRSSYKNTSGGSTGEPVTFIQDKCYEEWNTATKLHVNGCLGKKIGDKEIKLWGSDRDIIVGSQTPKENIINFIYHRKFFNSYILSQKKMEALIELNNRFQPDSYWSYADSAVEVSKFILASNETVNSPTFIMTTINPLHGNERNIIEKAFGCPCYDQYGSREAGWIACQNIDREEMYTFPWAHCVEILHSDYANSPRNEGKIVVTTLNNYSMPLIRYDIGDVGISSKQQICKNGVNVISLKKILGRSLGYFKKRDGTLMHAHYFVQTLYFKEWIKKFQVIQQDYEDIVLKIEKLFEPEESDLVEISTKIKLFMGNGCEVKFDFVDTIHPSKSGKYLYTICEI